MRKQRKGGRKASPKVLVSNPRRPGKTTAHKIAMGIDPAKPGSEKTVVGSSIVEAMGGKPCLVLTTRKGTAFFAHNEPAHVMAWKYGMIR